MDSGDEADRAAAPGREPGTVTLTQFMDSLQREAMRRALSRDWLSAETSVRREHRAPPARPAS